jgi:hypothetical protein
MDAIGRGAPAIRQYARQGRTFARYAAGLRQFLRTPVSPVQARERILRQLAMRHETFGTVVRRAVFDNPDSPYLPLFEAAGIEQGDVDGLLREKGVEGTLEVLYDAGVHMRLDEFKGRAPIERCGLSYEVAPEQFDNPLLAPVYRGRTGGSTGRPRAVQIDFAAIEEEASYVWLFLEAHDAHGMAQGMWRPVPPGGAGLGNALYLNKIGVPVARWFTQTWPSGGLAGATERAFMQYTLHACRRWGAGIERLERVSLDRPEPIARWLAAMVAAGTPAMLNAPASSAMRVAQAATSAGEDLSGTLMRTGGEPLTAAKAEAIVATGSRVACNYSMAEAGRLGIGCATPSATDDVHLLTDKIGVIQRRRHETLTGAPVEALLLSMLSTDCRKVMINVDVGDHGVLEDHACGCTAGELGLTLHLHGIRSHDKLTTGGMSFLASEVFSLVEEVMPSRFGGSVGDYQLVESEVDGLPSIAVVVRPEVGPVDESALIELVLETLRRGPSYRRMMTTFLEDGRTVSVRRRDPYATPEAKVMPLHIVNADL